MSACSAQRELSGLSKAVPGVPPGHRTTRDGQCRTDGKKFTWGLFSRISVDGSLLNLVWTYPCYWSTTFSLWSSPWDTLLCQKKHFPDLFHTAEVIAIQIFKVATKSLAKCTCSLGALGEWPKGGCKSLVRRHFFTYVVPGWTKQWIYSAYPEVTNWSLWEKIIMSVVPICPH